MDCFFSACINDQEDCEYKFTPTKDILVIIDDFSIQIEGDIDQSEFFIQSDIKPQFDSQKLTANSFPQRSSKF